MASAETIPTLNRLLAIHCQSLPSYLDQTAAWTRREDQTAAEVLHQIAEDQQYMVERIFDRIFQLRGLPERGHAEDLTSLNDLSIGFLLARVMDRQAREIAVMMDCVESLAGDPQSQALAEEALGMAKGHLESLEELDEQAASRES